MDPGTLTSIVALVLALSIASERLVEIVKGLVPSLARERSDPVQEGRRRSALQLMAVAAGVITALLARDYLPAGMARPEADWKIIGLGLLASGGSGLWNAVLTYLLKLKDLKKLEVDARR